MKTELIDLTDYTLEAWEGVQFFETSEAENYIKRHKLEKRAFIEKDEKPLRILGDWKQTYTIRKKS